MVCVLDDAFVKAKRFSTDDVFLCCGEKSEMHFFFETSSYSRSI